MKDLRQVTIIGAGLLGGSIALAVLRAKPGVKVVGYSHRASTRRKARDLLVGIEMLDDIKQSVASADLVILATPIRTFPAVFEQIADALPQDCIVTDVGSTKVLPHRWAAEKLPSTVHYQAMCILTIPDGTSRPVVRRLDDFWTALGCIVKRLTPPEHDEVFANVSHLPHAMAASLINANTSEHLAFSGKGFIDTSRVASGPANIWADILVTNAQNVVEALDRTIAQMEQLKAALEKEGAEEVTALLEAAREKRRKLINLKMRRKELLS